MKRGMVIVGAGECGARAAIALREHGYTGAVTLIGDETHAPYERPPLSKEAMWSDSTGEPKTIASREALFDKGISLMAPTLAETIDRTKKSVGLGNGCSLPYEKLLLTTGAAPRRIALSGNASHLYYLRTYDDILAIRRQLRPGVRIAVVGGGFIGLEVAAAVRRRGAEVTVIEAQPRILMRGVPMEIAAAVQSLHQAEGVEILSGNSIVAIAGVSAGVSVLLSEGRAVEADLAIIGIGAVPRTALAETAGLEIENGIRVDAELRSSDPDVFAAGDCCSFPLSIYGGRRVRLEAWRNALDQGSLAAKNMLGAGEAHAAVPWFWSDQYGSSLHIAGLADEGATVVRREVGANAFILFHLAADGRLVAASGFGPGNSVARDIRLAEMMIATHMRPDPDLLAASDTRLKSLTPMSAPKNSKVLAHDRSSHLAQP